MYSHISNNAFIPTTWLHYHKRADSRNTIQDYTVARAAKYKTC